MDTEAYKLQMESALENCRAYRKANQTCCMAIAYDQNDNWLCCLRYSPLANSSVSLATWITDIFQGNKYGVVVEISFRSK